MACAWPRERWRARCEAADGYRPDRDDRMSSAGGSGMRSTASPNRLACAGAWPNRSPVPLIRHSPSTAAPGAAPTPNSSRERVSDSACASTRSASPKRWISSAIVRRHHASADQRGVDRLSLTRCDPARQQPIAADLEAPNGLGNPGESTAAVRTKADFAILHLRPPERPSAGRWSRRARAGQ